MIGDPKVTVTCDKCGYEEEFGLNVTARGWNDSGLEENVRRLGWRVEKDGMETVCVECLEQEQADTEEEREKKEAEEAAAQEAYEARMLERRGDQEWQVDRMAWGSDLDYGYGG